MKENTIATMAIIGIIIIPIINATEPTKMRAEEIPNNNQVILTELHFVLTEDKFVDGGNLKWKITAAREL